MNPYEKLFRLAEEELRRRLGDGVFVFIDENTVNPYRKNEDPPLETDIERVVNDDD